MIAVEEMKEIFTPPDPKHTDLFVWGRHVFFWDTEVMSRKTDIRPQRVQTTNQGCGAFASRLIEVAVVDFRGVLVVHANLHWKTLQPSFPGVCVASAWHEPSRCCTVSDLLITMTETMPHGSILFEHGTNADCSKFNMLLEDMDPESPVLQRFLSMEYVAIPTATLSGVKAGTTYIFDGLRTNTTRGNNKLPSLIAMAKALLGLNVHADGGVFQRNWNKKEETAFVQAMSEGGLDSYVFFRHVFCMTGVKIDHCNNRNGNLLVLQIPDPDVLLHVTAVDDLVSSAAHGRFWTDTHHTAMPTQQEVRKSWTHQQRCLKFHTAAHDAGILRSCLVIQCLRWFFWFHDIVAKPEDLNTPPVRHLHLRPGCNVQWAGLEYDEDGPTVELKRYVISNAGDIRSSANIGLGFALMTKHETESITPGTESVFRLLYVASNRMLGNKHHTTFKRSTTSPGTQRTDAKRPGIFKVSATPLGEQLISRWVSTKLSTEIKDLTTIVTPTHFRSLVKDPPLSQGLESSRLLAYVRDAFTPEQRWYVPEQTTSVHDRTLHYIFCCENVRATASTLKRRLRYMTNELALHTVAAGLSIHLCKSCGCTNRTTVSTVYALYKQQPQTKALEDGLRVPLALAMITLLSSIVSARAKAPVVAALLTAIALMVRTPDRLETIKRRRPTRGLYQTNNDDL